MSRARAIVVLATVGVLVAGLSAAACVFTFSFDRIEAPLGTFGEIGVRVEKDHNNCTLPSMDDYQFAWEGIQILGETEWEEVGSNLYEKWFQVSLSALGEGYLRISKDCTKEGYEEATLPITVLAPGEEGVWRQANDGTYPFDDPQLGAIESEAGPGSVEDGTLAVGGLSIELPAGAAPDGDLGVARIFYAARPEGKMTPLLLVTETQFLRFDHLVADGT